MYEYRGLHDIIFISLYIGVAFLALLASLYLLFRRGNAFVGDEITSSRVLRRWTAALLAMMAASHVWWYVIGVYWLADDRLVRNIIAISLDYLTFVPLMMCVLIRMLQDRRRPLWPLIPLFSPIAVMAVVCIVNRNDIFMPVVEYYMVFLAITFIIYYVRAVRQYGRWLLDNYADLERKEVWQSLVFAIVLLLAYAIYTSNAGELMREYLSQVITIVVIAFLLWRVETLQELEES